MVDIRQLNSYMFKSNFIWMGSREQFYIYCEYHNLYGKITKVFDVLNGNVIGSEGNIQAFIKQNEKEVL